MLLPRKSFEISHFHEHGWMRIRGAVDAAAAQAMRDTAWMALEAEGIRRDQPLTWTVERPSNLQHVKADPAFRQDSAAVHAAIDAILEGRPYQKPQNWGALFLAFPGKTPWHIPTKGWHIDAYYASPLVPVRGVKTFALFADVAPRGGGTLMVSGSHRLVHRWFQENPPRPGTRSAQMRRLLLSIPYLRDLHLEGEAAERIRRFTSMEEIDGIPLRVVEAEGEAGDVILMHPLVMHVAAPNNSAQPRMMISGGVTTDMWGWN